MRELNKENRVREELQEGGEGLRQGASGMLALHEGAADLTDFCAHTPLAPCHLCNASFDFAAPPPPALSARTVEQHVPVRRPVQLGVGCCCRQAAHAVVQPSWQDDVTEVPLDSLQSLLGCRD